MRLLYYTFPFAFIYTFFLLFGIYGNFVDGPNIPYWSNIFTIYLLLYIVGFIYSFRKENYALIFLFSVSGMIVAYLSFWYDKELESLAGILYYDNSFAQESILITSLYIVLCTYLLYIHKNKNP